MDDLLARQATESDSPTLGRLGPLLMKIHYAFDKQRFMAPGTNPAEGYSWFLGSQLHEKDVVALVAERRGVVVGYVYAGSRHDRGREAFQPGVNQDPKKVARKHSQARQDKKFGELAGIDVLLVGWIDGELILPECLGTGVGETALGRLLGLGDDLLLSKVEGVGWFVAALVMDGFRVRQASAWLRHTVAHIGRIPAEVQS